MERRFMNQMTSSVGLKMNILEQQIKDTIIQALPDAEVSIGGDGTHHFEATVISAAFEGRTLLQQHQLVMKPLKQAFAGAVHALSLKTYTPEKYTMEKKI